MAASKPKMGFSMSLSGGGGCSGSGKYKPSSSSSLKKKSGDAKYAPRKKFALEYTGSRSRDDEDDGNGRELVSAIGDGKVVTAAPEKHRGPLVIGIARNRWEDGNNTTAAVCDGMPYPEKRQLSADAVGGRRSASLPAGAAVPTAAATTATSAVAAQGKSLDQLAAEAIARESRPDRATPDKDVGDDRYGLGLNSDRVIGMAAEEDVTGGGGGGGGPTLLLAQNMIPGLAEVEGEDAKFKHDLGYRAEDLSVRSQAYQSEKRDEIKMGDVLSGKLMRDHSWYIGCEGSKAFY